MSANDPTRRCQSPDAWPAPDRKAWADALRAGTDLLDENGAGSHWAEGTRKKVASAYGRWLTFLAGSGLIDPEASPAERPTPDRVRAYLAELEGTVAAVSAAGRIIDLAEALRVMAPGGGTGWIARLGLRLKVRAQPIRQKHLALRHSADLLNLGFELMETRGSKRRPESPLVAYRDGLMIAFLAARPLRIGCFSGLALGRHTLRVDTGYRLILAPEDVKERRHYETELPGSLTEPMDHYIGEVRPRLLGTAMTDRLWVAFGGRPLSVCGVYEAIRERTAARFGHPLHPHLFRDALATSIAVDDPEAIRSAAALLGHASLETTNKHYVQATGLVAARDYQAMVERLRHPPRLAAKPRRRA